MNVEYRRRDIGTVPPNHPLLPLFQLVEAFPEDAVTTTTFGGYNRNKAPIRIKYYGYKTLGENPLLRADLLRQVVYDKHIASLLMYGPMASGLFEDRDHSALLHGH